MVLQLVETKQIHLQRLMATDTGAAAVYLNGTGTGTLTAATNLTDLDNSTLASMTVSTAASSIKTGDVLVLQADGGDVDSESS